uniref:Exocyst complex component Sec6 n=1 Tax=Helicotheca tamesis TaxID=374047 RepID=A0A7S2HFS8_9STRA|mmetsp:Transcript_17592/g.24246  ORF Transcript_17592/g.24246 Transcript_17592/m.24246 type:complete len:447 (+) Transcript_17592:140-1480(+)
MILLFAMYTRQLAHRDIYLMDVEGCCAAANDFAKISELVEDWAIHMDARFVVEHGADGETADNEKGLILMKERELPDLVRLYSMDGEYCLRLACRFALDTMEEQLVGKEGVCGRGWEEDGIIPSIETSDDCPTAKPGAALTALLGTTEEFLNDAEECLCDEHQYSKVIEATIRGVKVHYVGRLLGRSERVRRRRTAMRSRTTQNQNSEENMSNPAVPFADPNVAARRIAEDIYTLKSFFRPWVLEMPAINQHIEVVFAPVMAMQKCLEVAGDVSRIGSEGTYDFVAELFDILNDDLEMTTKLIQDLWGLAMSLSGGAASIVVPASVKEEICRVANNATSRDEGSASTNCHVTPRFRVRGLSLRHLLLQLYCSAENSCDIIVAPIPKYVPILSRKKAVAALKADFAAAGKRLSNMSLSKSLSTEKMKKKANDFLKTCREGGKLSSRN